MTSKPLAMGGTIGLK